MAGKRKTPPKKSAQPVVDLRTPEHVARMKEAATSITVGPNAIISPVALAKMAGISKATYYEVLRRKRPVPAETDEAVRRAILRLRPELKDTLTPCVVMIESRAQYLRSQAKDEILAWYETGEALRAADEDDFRYWLKKTIKALDELRGSPPVTDEKAKSLPELDALVLDRPATPAEPNGSPSTASTGVQHGEQEGGVGGTGEAPSGGKPGTF